MKLRALPSDPARLVEADFVRLLSDMTSGERADLAARLGPLVGETSFRGLAVRNVSVVRSASPAPIRSGAFDAVWTDPSGADRTVRVEAAANVDCDVVTFLSASIVVGADSAGPTDDRLGMAA